MYDILTSNKSSIKNYLESNSKYKSSFVMVILEVKISVAVTNGVYYLKIYDVF